MLFTPLHKWSQRWLLARKNAASRVRPQRRRSPRLELEALEDRRVPVVGFGPSFAAPVATATGFDGVVRVNHTDATGTYLCTGSLLTTGRHILTAAHCLDHNAPYPVVDPGTFSVTFDMPGASPGTTRQIIFAIPAANITLHPSWNGNEKAGNDFAVITLPALAPSGPARGTGAERYDLYRSPDEIGKYFEVVGYGRTGVGMRGLGAPGSVPETGSGSGTKRWGANRWDADANLLGTAPMSVAGIMPPGRGLAYDFDNGTAANDAFGRAYGISHTGFGSLEAVQAPGDSGGPAFIGNRISGVVSFSRQRYASPPDVDAYGNNTFGEFAVMGRVSAVAGWIDTQVGGAHVLVLDMTKQLRGNDGVNDTIRVRRAGTNVEIVVNGSLYHSWPRSRITQLIIRGSNDADTIYADYVPATNWLVVDGAGGSDHLSLASTASWNTWQITGVNTGTGSIFLGGSFSFSNVETLAGGSGADWFVFHDGRSIGGISGEGGRDRLDYAAYTTAVSVNLTTGSATGVGGGAIWRVGGIEDVIGGTMGDTLTGNAAANELWGMGGNDILRGGGDNDALDGGRGNDQLFGETGRDTLRGAEDNDTLDGGLDGAPDDLYGGTGSNTFIDNQYAGLYWDPFTGTLRWGWISEDNLVDFNPAMGDVKIVRR